MTLLADLRRLRRNVRRNYESYAACAADEWADRWRAQVEQDEEVIDRAIELIETNGASERPRCPWYR